MDKVSEVCKKGSESITTCNYAANKNVSNNLSKTFNSIPNERGFKMAFLNIVSVPKKIDEIRLSMFNKNIDLLAFNETRLASNITDNYIHLDG